MVDESDVIYIKATRAGELKQPPIEIEILPHHTFDKVLATASERFSRISDVPVFFRRAFVENGEVEIFNAGDFQPEEMVCFAEADQDKYERKADTPKGTTTSIVSIGRNTDLID